MSVSIKIKGKSPLRRGMGISGNHSLLDWIGSFGAEDIGIDIGTSNVVFYIKRKGIVFPEAAVVARNKLTGSYLSSGTKAEEMEGKTPPEIEIIHPIERSAVVDYSGIAYLVNSVVNQSYFRGILFHPRLMMCVPVGINNVQRRALLEVAVSIGARKTVLIEQPLAALMGMQKLLRQRAGVMIVDIGGGTTKISVSSRNGIVLSHLSGESGNEMDLAIMKTVRDKYHVKIGKKAAESVKIALGVEWDTDNIPRVAEIFGISLISGLPVKIAVTGEDIAQAVNPILYRILKDICNVLERTPPVLLKEIRKEGILLIGGAARLKGIEKLISRLIGVEAQIADKASYVNAVGAGAALEYIDSFRDSLQDLH